MRTTRLMSGVLAFTALLPLPGPAGAKPKEVNVQLLGR